MKDKLFLTGALHVGKSTCVDKVLLPLAGDAAGFRTWFQGEARDVLMLSNINHSDAQVVARLIRGGGRAVSTEVFNTHGTALLRAAQGARLVVMDELGRLEQEALGFQAQVLKTLDAPSPVLGVLRHNAHGWLDAVRLHPRVRVIEVTLDNRDTIPKLLLETLAELGVQ